MKSWITLMIPNAYVYMDLRRILIDNVPLRIERNLYGAFEDAINFGIVVAHYNDRTKDYKLVATERGLDCRMQSVPYRIYIPIE